MGFGLLLIGYFFVAVVSLFSPLSLAMLVGYPLMITALWRLAPYQRNFRTAFFFSFLSLPFAFYYALQALGEWGLLSGDLLSASILSSCCFSHCFGCTVCFRFAASWSLPDCRRPHCVQFCCLE